jgi:hypothetical protein
VLTVALGTAVPPVIPASEVPVRAAVLGTFSTAVESCRLLEGERRFFSIRVDRRNDPYPQGIMVYIDRSVASGTLFRRDI